MPVDSELASYAAGHLEKHNLEQEAVKTALSVQRKDTDDYRNAHLATHATEQEAVKTALESEKHRLEDHRLAHQAAHAAHETLHSVEAIAHKEQHRAEQTAVVAAQESMDKRLDQMNEFRDQLRDQAGTFVRRDALDTFVARYERDRDGILALVATEREERRANEGSRHGAAGSINWIIAAIGASATVLGIIIVLSNVLTSVPK